MPRISQLPSLTTADNADEIAIVDVSASTTKKITRGDLLKSPLPTNSVTTAAVADNAITADKVDFSTFGIIHSTGLDSTSITVPGPGYIYVEFVKIYYNNASTQAAGSASINLPDGATNIFDIPQTGGGLGSVTYATTLIAKRKFSVSAGGTVNITTAGSSGAGVISRHILASFMPF